MRTMYKCTVRHWVLCCFVVYTSMLIWIDMTFQAAMVRAM